MTMYKWMSLCIIVVMVTMTAHAQQSSNESEVVQLSDPIQQTDRYEIYGSAFKDTPKQVPLEDLVNGASQFADQTVTTKGTIKKVCQKKGCFFIMETADNQQIRISFKDYGFFIPTNTAGSTVRLNGTFTVKKISEDDAQHYARDMGDDPESIEGPQHEFGLVATSVIIYK
ncbi:MAG: DUF4920 domain-containing protein [Bacteroidota bacterium]